MKFSNNSRTSYVIYSRWLDLRWLDLRWLDLRWLDRRSNTEPGSNLAQPCCERAKFKHRTRQQFGAAMLREGEGQTPNPAAIWCSHVARGRSSNTESGRRIAKQISERESPILPRSRENSKLRQYLFDKMSCLHHHLPVITGKG